MPNLTRGVFKVDAMQAITSASLTDIAAAMAAQPPRQAGFVPGWGSVEDDASWLGRANFAPPVGRPEIYEGIRDYPPILVARLYWFEANSSIVKLSGDAPLTPNERHSLSGIDVLIYESGDQSLTVLTTTRDFRAHRAFIDPAIRRLLSGVDPAAQLHADVSPLHLGSRDFFLWLIAKSMHDSQIAQNLRIEQVHQVNSQDGPIHGAVFRYGIDPDRADINATLSRATAELGPAKLLLRDDYLGLTIDFELFVDGGFAVKNSETEYDDDDFEVLKRVYGVIDLAHHIVPLLEASYSGDATWDDNARQRFREERWQRLMSLPR